MKNALKIAAVNFLVLVALLLGLEVVGQAVALAWPSYAVLFLEPDRLIGWKEVPNLEWTWTGHEWYAADFTVHVKTNPLGFRDLPRVPAKPDGTTRVAVLGDSFIEAVQVPFEQTATQLLEKSLNGAGTGTRWEVLNFGISNFGIGQYFLTWQHYARQFTPDYVAVFVAKLHMQRTIQKYEGGAFPGTERKQLWVRPTFRLENGELVLEPAEDFDGFVAAQKQLMETTFDGRRSRRRSTWITYKYARDLKHELGAFGERTFAHRGPQTSAPPDQNPAALLPVNLKLLETLGQQIEETGARFIVLDVSQYVDDDNTTTPALVETCTANGFGYVPVYQQLRDARAKGTPMAWKHDGHLTVAGNAVLAGAMSAWIRQARAAHAAQ